MRCPGRDEPSAPASLSWSRTEACPWLISTMRCAGFSRDWTAPEHSTTRRQIRGGQEPDPEEQALVRRAAAASVVLLRNDGVLPLRTGSLTRIAVVGDHAAMPRIQGGGSAQVVERRITAPLEALSSALGDGVEVVFERGCEVDQSATLVGRSVFSAPDGFEVEVFDGLEFSGDVVRRGRLEDLRLFVFSPAVQDYPEHEWSLRARGRVVPAESGTFSSRSPRSGERGCWSMEWSCSMDSRIRPRREAVTFSASPARNWSARSSSSSGNRSSSSSSTPGWSRRWLASGSGSARRTPTCCWTGRRRPPGRRYRRGVRRNHPRWETEGSDRTFFALPGRQDDLVRSVAGVNQRTVVVINAGAPVDMPWEHDVAAVLQCWFGGEEMAAGVADVLIGGSTLVVDCRQPCRLSSTARPTTTSPVRMEKSATARGCSWAIEASTTVASNRVTPSAMG